MENFEPHRGAFAYCSRGELGLITSETPVRVVYNSCLTHAEHPDQEWRRQSCVCETGIAWIGIHLSPEKFGQPWSSRTPRVVGEIRQDTFADAALYVVEGRHFGRALLEL